VHGALQRAPSHGFADLGDKRSAFPAVFFQLSNLVAIARRREADNFRPQSGTSSFELRGRVAGLRQRHGARARADAERIHADAASESEGCCH
jgi:hypothetical protein